MQDTVNRAAFNLKRAADRYSIRQPIAWSITMDAAPTYSQEMLDLYYGNFQQRYVTGIDPAAWDAAIINERSKPMGLSKKHVYTDKDGDTIAIKAPVEADGEEAVAYVKVVQYGEYAGVFVDAKSSIPLALNVLGYDRPSAKPYAAGPTKYRDATANEAIPGSQIARDTNIAKAIDLLIGADIYDQRVDANEAAAKREAEAKRARHDELLTKRNEAADQLRRATSDLNRIGVGPSTVLAVKTATEKYETAQDALRRGV